MPVGDLDKSLRPSSASRPKDLNAYTKRECRLLRRANIEFNFQLYSYWRICASAGCLNERQLLVMCVIVLIITARASLVVAVGAFFARAHG